MIYIQLLKDTTILENEIRVHRKAGEWLEVQRNVAIRLLIEGRARVLDYPTLLTAYGSIRWWGGEDARDMFELHTPLADEPESFNNIAIAPEKGELKNPITILVGLQALQNWHVAIPLSGYLMSELTSMPDEEFDTKTIIRDLRVPAYNSKYLFWRSSEHGKRWYSEYEKQLNNGISRAHALIRSLYITKPYHIALPENSIR